MRLILLTLLISILFPFYIHSQWVLQQTGTTEALYDIEFINNKTGWACGINGVILKTTNGGTNWILQPNDAIGKQLLGIHPVDSNIVYCVGWFETILKTTNGGINWTALQNGPVGKGNSYFSVFFLNENTGWVGSTGAKVLKTTNSGINFSDSPTNAIVRDLYFKDNLNGIGVSEVAIISKTSNGGINWSVSQIAGSGDIERISILNNSDTGIVVAAGPNIVYKTINFGNSWDSVGYIENVTGELFCSEFINDTVGWAGGSHELFRTVNGGKKWYKQNLPVGFIASIFAYNDKVVWTSGAGGRIWYTTNGGDTIVSIKQISTDVPIAFELKQNYPNPFNPSTTIEFQISKTNFISLKIYDITGREI